MPKLLTETTAQGMLRVNTPIEHYPQYNLWVKREDMACTPPGPYFSKARGVYAHVKSRPERVIGVLDTRHSQAGHAVARACSLLGKKCINFYPVFKHEWGIRPAQEAAQGLGAELIGLPAGRSAILYHAARKQCEALGAYLMPNALKLPESVTETAKEVPNGCWDQIIIPISSGTIAAGVIQGFTSICRYNSSPMPVFVLHLGYSRSHAEVAKYVREKSKVEDCTLIVVDEEYSYKDGARAGDTPPWPCNEYYDLKAFRYWMSSYRERMVDQHKTVLFWNIG